MLHRHMAILKNTPKSASEYLTKLLRSAVANAENNFNMDASKLYVSECFVCPGPILKRIMPRAQGRALQNPEENEPCYHYRQGKSLSKRRLTNRWVRK